MSLVFILKMVSNKCSKTIYTNIQMQNLLYTNIPIKMEIFCKAACIMKSAIPINLK